MSKGRVLAVGDMRTLNFVSDALTSLDYEVVATPDLFTAMETIAAEVPEAAVVDLTTDEGRAIGFWLRDHSQTIRMIGLVDSLTSAHDAHVAPDCDAVILAPPELRDLELAMSDDEPANADQPQVRLHADLVDTTAQAADDPSSRRLIVGLGSDAAAPDFKTAETDATPEDDEDDMDLDDIYAAFDGDEADEAAVVEVKGDSGDARTERATVLAELHNLFDPEAS